MIEQTNLPWIEKFRPYNLNDVISNKSIIKTFKKYVETKYLPHILFHGPSGTGKTSTIYACARQLYGEDYEFMVLEINASEERGIEVVRNKIKEFISSKCLFASNQSLFKLVILDEADSMTSDAQSMLRRLIEDFTSNARFCLICNKIKSIDPALQSRCTSFRFAPLSSTDITKKLNEICKTLKIKITDDGIDAILRIARGDMRKVLNILQATSMAYETINRQNVEKCMGYPQEGHIRKIYNGSKNKTFNKLLEKTEKIKIKYGYSLLEIITELHNIVMKEYLNNNIDDIKFKKLVLKMKDIELNLVSCPSDSLQLPSIVSLFYQ